MSDSNTVRTCISSDPGSGEDEKEDDHPCSTNDQRHASTESFQDGQTTECACKIDSTQDDLSDELVRKSSTGENLFGEKTPKDPQSQRMLTYSKNGQIYLGSIVEEVVCTCKLLSCL